jgi:peptide/nickel transport system substrate-binding protein
MRSRLPALLATAAILVAACSGAASPGPSSPAASSQPSEGATSPSPAPSGPLDFEDVLFGYEYTPSVGTPGGGVVISDWQAASQLNPVISTSLANSYVFAATMRGLFTVTADGHWKPDLAAKMPKFSDDSIRPDADGAGFEIDLELKPGLLWSDGTPLTLNDLEYTWQWVLDPDLVGVTTLGWDVIDAIDVADDGLKATVHFTENYAGYYGLFATSFLPEHYMSTIPVEQANESYPISPALANAPVNGPFKYVTASPDTIELERNENWKAGDHAPYLDRVTFKYYPDNKEGLIGAFLAGETDVALDLVESDYQAIEGIDPSVGRALLVPAWLYEHLDLNQAGAGPGRGHPALQDLEVRKAISQAIDRDELFRTVFPGGDVGSAEICTNAVPTNYWRIPDEDVECPAFDVGAANATLDAAGYMDTDTNGVREMPNGGEPLIFEHCSSAVNFRQTGGEYLKKSLAAIGIQLNLNFVDSTAVLFANWPDVSADTKCNTYHGTYDTAEFAYSLTFDLFGNYYYSYHSEQVPTDENGGNGYNTVRFNDPEMDDALDVLRDAIDPEAALQAAYTVQQVFVDKLVEQTLYYRNEVRGYATRIQNLDWNPSNATEVWNIEDWWIQE